jgi:radical SAM superfamily enzyme YgiQ (UPF0313 family)
MKIGFIEPVYKETIIGYNKHIKKVLEKHRKFFPLWDNPSLGILTAAALVPKNWDVEYIHSYVDDIDYDAGFDMIAISGMTSQAEDIYKIARHFRKRGVYVIIGGIHATVLPEEVKDYADTLIVGEAEDSFRRFIVDFSHNNPKSVYYPENEVDLSKSPLPRFDLLNKNYGAYTIQTTRGCPHNCKFCSATRIFGEKYRHKKVEQVVEEVKFLKSIRHNPFIIFVDDNMFVNRSFSHELLEALIPLDIKWHTLTDVSVGRDLEFLKLLFKAGCRELFVGFESLNPESLKDVNKTRWKEKQVPEYELIIQNIQSCGIRVYGSFILGFDNDTWEEYQNIKKFVVKNKIVGEFPILTPLPGSELYEEFIETNRFLENKSWKYFNFIDCVIKHPNFTSDELEWAVADLYRVTYSKENYGRVMGNLVDIFKRLNV